MPARLILNADDFGLTRGINRAIVELHHAGVLTSATLMANGPAFDDAVALALANPTLGVGCHIVLTDGIPVSPPHTIAALLDHTHPNPTAPTFRPSLAGFLQALLLGRIREEDILHEALAQIRKLQRAGIRVTHLDTHKHTHLFPRVTRPILRAAELTGIHAIRNPFEPPWSLALNHGSRLRRLAVGASTLLRPRFHAHPQLRAADILTPNGTVAISATGELTARTLAEVLRALPPTGTFELCCHPGYNDPDLDRVTTRLRAHRDIERQALLTEIPKLFASPGAPSLISYAALAQVRATTPTPT